MMIAFLVCIYLVLSRYLHHLSGWVDGLAILVTVMICAGVTSLNDWSKDRQFRKLNDTKKDIKIKVYSAFFSRCHVTYLLPR